MWYNLTAMSIEQLNLPMSIEQLNLPETFQRCPGIRMCQTRMGNLLTGTVVSSKIRCGECLRRYRSWVLDCKRREETEALFCGRRVKSNEAIEVSIVKCFNVAVKCSIRELRVVDSLHMRSRVEIVDSGV